MRDSLDFYRQANAAGASPPLALRARFIFNPGMEAKASDGFDLVDSTVNIESDLMDQYPEVSFHETASSVRNFGHGGASLAEDPDSEFASVEKDLLKLEPGAWSEIAENLLHLHRDPQDCGADGSVPVPAAPGMCKLIKDEREPALIMDPARCAASFEPVGGESGTSLLLDLARSSPPSPFQHLRSAGEALVPAAKSVLNLEAVSAPSPQHMLMCKSEVNRWHLTPSPAEFWCPPAGLTEEPQGAYPGLDGTHGAGFGQLSAAFGAFASVPPQRMCVICGDEASGCHYGVLTCGSCKVFFKRAVEGHHKYLCAGRNDCIVDKIRRKNCPACRLRKCYQAGMMLGGRKLKRFGVLKAMGLNPSLMFQNPLTLPVEPRALSTLSCMPAIRELQLTPQIISILESIEPEVVYSGYDNSQPDMPHLLLNSLNRLCERQLLWIVRWSKSLPGFRNLHISDQMTLIQYSWMNLMVFSLGWRTFQNVTGDYMYFAPDLILSQERMRRSPIYDLCLAMQIIPQEFASLQVSREEFLCMKALVLLNTVPLEGLKSQGQFDEMRQSYIRELTKVIQIKEKGVVGSSQRFYHLTKLMDSMHEIVKKVNLYCLSTFIQADAMKVEFPEMMTEVIASQLPKVLAGMVRPLLFHNK
ncbi:progesterone receptor [Astyanax mexicanus]|uniref:progesterone receptor n=1 Tax=Astyanax mexicanus TaxID=7994 RepID=UPI0020CB572B|nr:progesterone receptor [Astyanax mexicanus]